MKKLLLFCFLLMNLAAFAQPHPGYTPKVNAYGNAYSRGAFDSALHIPNKPCLCLLDNDTTPQIFVFADTLRGFWNGAFHNMGPGGSGGSFTADGISLQLIGSQFSIKPSWTGQTGITTLGTITTGIWQSTPIADAYIASAATWNAKLSSVLPSANILVGNGSNIATAVSPSGDWSINNAGVATLSSVIVGGNCTSCNITYDAKGRITVAANGTPGSAPFPDNGAIIKNNADNTRLLILSAASISTATTRTWTFPDVNGTVARIDAAQTFTGIQSFLSNPVLNTTSTVGYVWTASGTAGQGGWAAPTGGTGLNQLTGDGTAGPGTGSQAFTLATVNGTTGTFGDGVHIPVFTVNGKGLITNVTLAYIDSTKFVTQWQFNNSLDSFLLRNVGADAGFQKVLWAVNGSLVSANLIPFYSLSFSHAADSGLRMSVDTSCAHCAASKDYVDARFGGGGSGTPGGSVNDIQINNTVFAGGGPTWDFTGFQMAITKTLNGEIGYYVVNTNVGASATGGFWATNGPQSTKLDQAGSGYSFGMLPASGGYIYSNATHFSVWNANNAGEINLGVGASITLPTVTLTLTQLKIVPSILPTGVSGDSLLAYHVSDNGVYAIAQSLFGRVANPLSQFASTTSSQLAGVLSDETGTGVVAFSTSPLFTTPRLASTSTTGYVWTATDALGNGSFQVGSGGGIALDALQTYTSGTTVTISNGNNILYADPASAIATLTITLPATPHNSNRVRIHFGGTIRAGNVINTLIISPNSGQTIIDNTPPGLATADDMLAYDWRSSNSTWYRVKP